jgi:hypothetical protein
MLLRQSRTGGLEIGGQIGGRAGRHRGCDAKGRPARTAGNRRGRGLLRRGRQITGRRRIDKGAFHRGPVREKGRHALYDRPSPVRDLFETGGGEPGQVRGGGETGGGQPCPRRGAIQDCLGAGGALLQPAGQRRRLARSIRADSH